MQAASGASGQAGQSLGWTEPASVNGGTLSLKRLKGS